MIQKKLKQFKQKPNQKEIIFSVVLTLLILVSISLLIAGIVSHFILKSHAVLEQRYFDNMQEINDLEIKIKNFEVKNETDEKILIALQKQLQELKLESKQILDFRLLQNIDLKYKSNIHSNVEIFAFLVGGAILFPIVIGMIIAVCYHKKENNLKVNKG